MGFHQQRGQPRSLRRGRNGRDVTKDRLSRHCLLAIPVGDFTPNFKGDHDVAFGALFLPPLVRGGLTPRNGLVGRHRRGQVADEARFKIDERLGRGGWHGENRVDAADDTRGPAERQSPYLRRGDYWNPSERRNAKGARKMAAAASDASVGGYAASRHFSETLCSLRSLWLKQLQHSTSHPPIFGIRLFNLSTFQPFNWAKPRTHRPTRLRPLRSSKAPHVKRRYWAE